MIPIPDRLTLKLIACAGAALLLALLVHDRNHWKAKTMHYAELLAAERTAHASTVANYRAAAEQARRDDAAHAARVKAEQAAINERTKDEFESRIAAARARAGELHGKTAAADSGGGAKPPMPGLFTAAGGADQGAGKDGLSRSDRLIATEQAIQLDELVRWVRRQAEVNQAGN